MLFISHKSPGKRTISRFPKKAPIEREDRIQGLLHISEKPHLSGFPVKEPSPRPRCWLCFRSSGMLNLVCRIIVPYIFRVLATRHYCPSQRSKLFVPLHGITFQKICMLKKNGFVRINVTLRHFRVTFPPPPPPPPPLNSNRYYIFSVYVCILSYPARKAHAPYYFVICDLCCCAVFFPRCLINGMTFGGKKWLLNLKKIAF
jgi:hypothetical protein